MDFEDNKPVQPEDQPAVENNVSANADFHQYGEMPKTNFTEPEFHSEKPVYQVIEELSKPKTMAFSVASLILGILSVVCCCGVYTGLILGIAAIVFAIVSRKHLGYFEGMAIAGLILGIFGVIFGAAILVFTYVFNWQNWLDEVFQEATGEPFMGIGEM